MKNYYKLFFLSLLIAITSSCKKEINYHTEWDVSSMSAKVDGVLLQCTTATAAFFKVDEKTTLQLLGNKAGSGFGLTIDDFKGIGTYNLSDFNLAVYVPNSLDPQNSYLSYSGGSIKITAYNDKIIKGTFEFEGENIFAQGVKKITEGQFSISLVPAKLAEVDNNTVNGDNGLAAKIDGSATVFTGEAVAVNSPFGNLLTIVTLNGDKRIILSVLEYKGVGTYDLSGDATGLYMKDQTPTGSFSSESGKLIITSEAGGKLKGTFFFDAKNDDSSIATTVKVTEGTFNLPFSKK